MGTAHNMAKEGQFAKTVLMPGDPLRAKFVAETFFENPIAVNDVRGMLAFTGTYKGKPVSVMGSGMGMPSIGIYSYELFKFYGVENIIRIGSAGAYTDKIKMFDVILASESYSDSTYALMQSGAQGTVQKPSAALCAKIEDSAAKKGMPIIKGPIHSSDVFYYEENYGDFNKVYEDKGCLCVEMESYSLFHNAKVLGKNAACILTISDSLVTHEEVSAQARQNSFTNMMEIALGAV